MKGATIVQEVRIFDPSTLPDYIDAVKKYTAVIPLKIEYKDSKGKDVSKDLLESTYSDEKKKAWWEKNFGTKLPPKDDIDRFYDGTAMSMELYPSALSYLNQLNISKISDIRDHYHGGKIEIEADTLQGLQANVAKLARTMPAFNADVNPHVLLGSNNVTILMHYSAADDFEVKKKTGRSIVVSCMFDEPEKSRVGLRNIKKLFPEAIFNEELYILEKSEEVKEASKKERDYFKELLEKRTFTKERLGTLETLRDESNDKLLEFSMPYLERLGINPRYTSYYKGKKSKIVGLKSFEDLEKKIHSEEMKTIPVVYADFGGRNISMDFFLGNLTFDMSDRAVKIESSDADGTLEDLLQKYNSL
jgi:hypothetical protein